MHSSWYSRNCIFGGAIVGGKGKGGALGILRALDAYLTGMREDKRPVSLEYLSA